MSQDYVQWHSTDCSWSKAACCLRLQSGQPAYIPFPMLIHLLNYTVSAQPAVSAGWDFEIDRFHFWPHGAYNLCNVLVVFSCVVSNDKIWNLIAGWIGNKCSKIFLGILWFYWWGGLYKIHFSLWMFVRMTRLLFTRNTPGFYLYLFDERKSVFYICEQVLWNIFQFK